MEEFVNLALNSGVSIVVIAFFMYKDLQFTKTLNQTLTSLQESVDLIKRYFIGKEREEDDAK